MAAMARSTWRRWGLRGIAPLAAFVLLAAFMVPANAAPYGGGVENTGLFQLEGDTTPIACPPNDWAGLYNAFQADNTTPPCGSDGFKFVADGVGSADATYWSGGGSKDAYDPALGPWMWAPNDVSPDKNDIDNAFAAAYHLGGGTSATDLTRFLFFGADRFNTSGDAQMGFQFLQADTCLAGPVGTTSAGDPACPAGTPNQTANAGKFVDPTTGDPVHHTNGDVLALVNFNNGGTLGLSAVFVWSGGATPPDGSGHYVQALTGNGAAADCKTIADPNNFCSTSNTGNLTGEPVWPYTAKNQKGKTITSYTPSAFIEGGINLNAIPNSGSCFPSFLAETRSSAGPSSGLGLTAQLKDLAFGKFELCGSGITTTPKDGSGGAIGSDGLFIGSGGSVTATDSADLIVSGIDTWSGTIKFFLCGPFDTSSTATCDGTTGQTPDQVGTQIGTDAQGAVNQDTPMPFLSQQATITSPGRYCWRAEFTSPTPGVPDATDGTATECFIVNKVQTTISTRQFVYPQDKAVIDLPSAGTLTGNVTFRLFGATASPLATALENCTNDDGTATSQGLLYAPASTAISGAAPQSAKTNNTTVAVTSDATVYWHVIYDSTDGSQIGSESNCVENTAVNFTGDDSGITVP
jgi:hypothetical protein